MVQLLNLLKNSLKNLDKEGKKQNLYLLVKKAFQSLRRFYEQSIIDNISDFANPRIEFSIASSIRDKILELFLMVKSLNVT